MHHTGPTNSKEQNEFFQWKSFLFIPQCCVVEIFSYRAPKENL
jgi:hypothetical protein